MTWGGLGGLRVLGVLVLMERLVQLRRGRVTPTDFLRRFRERLQDGKLDRGKALDLCELNPSPAARVALAAVKRWGRPVADLERAVALAAGSRPTGSSGTSGRSGGSRRWPRWSGCSAP